MENIVYLELRSFSKIFKLFGDERYTSIPSISLCNVVSQIIEIFTNQIIKVN
jgi:hypothetical protein